MNKIYFLVFFSLVVFTKAQTFSFADHRGQESSGNMIAINNKVYYTTNIFRIDGCCNDSIFIIGRNGQGSEVFRKFVYSGPFLNSYKVKKLSNNQLLVHVKSEFTNCDEYSDNSTFMLCDTLGVSTWTFHTSRTMADAAPSVNGGFVLFSSDSIFHFTAQGNLFGAMPHGLGAINSVLEYSTGLYVASVQTPGGARLRKFNAQCQLISDVPTAIGIGDLQKSADGGIIGISGTQAIKYSPNFGLLHTSAIANNTIYCIATRGDSVFAGTRNQNAEPAYVLLDSAFSIQHTSATNFKNMVPRGISVSSDNAVNVIYYAYKNAIDYTVLGGPINRSAESGFFKTKINGNIFGKYDIGVKRIEITSNYADMFSGFPRKAITNAKVTVFNYGADTVRKFNLNLFLGTGGINYCQFGLNRTFTGLLLPGDSISVITGTFTSRVWSDVSSPSQANYTFCVFSSIPNTTNDINISNDAACVGASYLPVSTGIENRLESEKLYPNPVANELHISSDAIIQQLIITDVSGRKVQEIKLNQKTVSIDTSEFEPGIYFIQMKTGQTVIQKKIIKE
jgi:hypothetical protein